MKRIITILVFIILSSGLMFLFVFANLKQDQVVCQNFEIIIDYKDAPQLITNNSIKKQITIAGIRIKNQLVTNINTEKVQNIINQNPYVKRVTVSIGVNGTLTAYILQRNPVLRVIDKTNNHFLIDEDGRLMPVNNELPTRLILASGNISNIQSEADRNSKKDQTGSSPIGLAHLLSTANGLRSDSLTYSLIEQIYVNDGKEIELIPKVGSQSIILGDTLELKEKLHKLKIFYLQGMKNEAWNTYKVINLKYKNQVVCTK